MVERRPKIPGPAVPPPEPEHLTDVQYEDDAVDDDRRLLRNTLLAFVLPWVFILGGLAVLSYLIGDGFGL